MNSISKIEALIFLPAYQNQGTLVDYLDPWIAMWANDFILTGLSNRLHLKILEAGFTEDELEDVVKVQPDIRDSQFGFEKELLKEWSEWIIGDHKKQEIVKAELEKYFYWQGKPFWDGESDGDSGEVPWYCEDEGMPRTPQEALDWFQDVFNIR